MQSAHRAAVPTASGSHVAANGVHSLGQNIPLSLRMHCQRSGDHDGGKCLYGRCTYCTCCPTFMANRSSPITLGYPIPPNSSPQPTSGAIRIPFPLRRQLVPRVPKPGTPVTGFRAPLDHQRSQGARPNHYRDNTQAHTDRPHAAR